MAEISSYGYQSLRDYIQSNWKYIELQNELNNPVLRLSPSDTRVTWIHNAGEQILKLQIIVKGSDTDITYPVTFTKSLIFDVATGGNAYSEEPFTAFTIESDNDELTVIHSIEVPQVL